MPFMIANGTGLLSKPFTNSDKLQFSTNIFNADLIEFTTIDEALKVECIWESTNPSMIIEMTWAEYGKTKTVPTAPAICFVSKEGAMFTPIGMFQYGYPPFMPNPYLEKLV